MLLSHFEAMLNVIMDGLEGLLDTAHNQVVLFLLKRCTAMWNVFVK